MAYALALDVAGRAYVTGYQLQRLPHHPRRLRHELRRSGTTPSWCGSTPAGSALDYATFLGGQRRWTTGAGPWSLDAAGGAYRDGQYLL